MFLNSSLKFLAAESAAVAYCNYKKWVICPASNKQQHCNRAFKGLNDEGSHTTVFRAWHNVSTSLHDQATHRQSIWETRIKLILLYHALYISESGSVCASQWLRREHAADMVSHPTGLRCLIELNYHNKRTRHVSSPDLRVGRRVVGFIRSKSDE